MANYAGDNLRRLMATRGLTLEQVVAKSGLDKRTVLAILDGSNRTHMRTLNRLAQGLNIAVDELFLDPTQLLYRHVDHPTNPLVQAVIDKHPHLFANWTAADFVELHRRFSAGSPATFEEALVAVHRMNDHRQTHAWLSELLESSHAEVVRDVLHTFYQRVIKKNRS